MSWLLSVFNVKFELLDQLSQVFFLLSFDFDELVIDHQIFSDFLEASSVVNG